MSGLKKSSLKSKSKKKNKLRVVFSEKNQVLEFEKIDPALKNDLWWSLLDQNKARNEYIYELLCNRIVQIK